MSPSYEGNIGRVKFKFPPPTREELKNNSPISPSYEGGIEK